MYGSISEVIMILIYQNHDFALQMSDHSLY